MLSNLPPNALIIMGLVVIFLVIGSFITTKKIKQNPEKDYTELKQRVISWWYMIGILFVCFSLGYTTIIVLFAVISFLALKEFFSIVPLRLIDRRVIFWVYLTIPIQYYWIAIQWHTMSLIFIPVYLFLFIPIRLVLLGEVKGFIRSVGILQWGAMLTIFCIGHLAMLVGLPATNPSAGGLGLVLFILLLTQFNDVMQYVWGKSFGKHKIIPKVSPNKTWEGFLGGIFSTSILASLLGMVLTPMPIWLSFIAGIVIAIAGFLGDVVMSSVKRDLSIKDCSTLIPGHGGILDRMDSLTFSAPLFFHFYYYLFV